MENINQSEATALSRGNDQLSLEEFSITELEDRLEFLSKCTINIKPPSAS